MKRISLIILAMFGVGIVQVSTVEATTVEFSKFVKEIKIKGDLRLRHELFSEDPGMDRHRQRIRLRVVTKFKISDFTTGIRIASGSADQTSTNQTFDSLFSSKDIFLDRAYLSWKGSETKWMKLTGGKMPTPFFKFYSMDIVMYSDVNPEGFFENSVIPAESEIFVNLSQFVLDQNAGFKRQQWMFGQ